MKRFLLTIPALASTFLAVPSVEAAGPDPIRVVATLPNLAAIVREVGGDAVEVTAIASGAQDPHFVDPKPSFIVLLRRADFLVANGLDLEVGWVPPLTQGARNRRLLPGEAGYIDASQGIARLEVPSTVNRAMGDVHPYGNPHYLSDPLNAEPVAGQIAAALSAFRPEQAAAIEKRRADFVRRLHVACFGQSLVDEVGGAKLARLARAGQMESLLSSPGASGKPLVEQLGGWIGKMRPIAGTKIVTYHRDFSYFVDRFGLVVADSIEPKPGIPPSPRHIEELTARLKSGDVRVIVGRPYVETRSAEALTERTGVPHLVLPLEVGGAPEASGFFQLFDYVTSSLLAAIGPKEK